MLAMLVTLAFLTVIWLCATIVAGTLAQSEAKIIAALKGRSLLVSPPISPIAGRVSQIYPSRRRPMRALVELRAAA